MEGFLCVHRQQEKRPIRVSGCMDQDHHPDGIIAWLAKEHKACLVSVNKTQDMREQLIGQNFRKGSSFSNGASRF